jgi:flagellar biosynthetic protein FlhB
MAEQGDAQERTEDPSARRLEKAREEGQVALSPELPALAVLGGAATMLAMTAPGMGRALVDRLGVMVEQAHVLTLAQAKELALGTLMITALPFVAAAIVLSAAATLLQTGFLLRAEAALPDLSRLSPARGLARVFGVDSLINGAKSVIKIAVVGTAAWMVLGAALPDLARAFDWEAENLVAQTAVLVLRMLIAMLVAQALITVADMLITRIRHTRSLRMSRQELRDEHKEMEGDPHIKARLKRMRLQRGRRRMLAEVPKATVVITNPTHYAVALAYDRGGDAAPRIVAKGVDEMAARIRETAQAHGVPIVANPPLARALYPHELDRAIPAEFFAPVAEIIAYVWRLRGQAR